MVDDDDTGRAIHVGLPLPTVQELADRMAYPPSAELQDHIVILARRRAERLGWWRVNPIRLAEKLQKSGVEVTAEQVAYVLLTRLQVRP